jgi:cytidylate kinase
MSDSKIIIDIDGYSSCGKSTLAKGLAARLGYKFIDSGAMYRAITLYLIRHNISLEQFTAMSEEEKHALLKKLDIDFRVNPFTHHSETFLNGENVEQHIRGKHVSEIVSPLSAIREVRQLMVQQQQQLGKRKGIVMDGRDIGTTVFPDAEVKIFMTADNDVRVKRRYEELLQNGIRMSMEEVKKNIETRDYNDTHRKESPLRQADDAVVLDNTNLDKDEQLNFVLDVIRKYHPEALKRKH